ncbi:MAG: glycosyltransferase [Phycisphaeraceae bacterium]|nr:glycosyltransferase [Phycisphaeraceae bacterium]
MRIIHVIGSLDPAAGGPPMVASRLAAAQAALDHHVRIVCYMDPHQQQDAEEALLAVPGFDRVRLNAISTAGLTEQWLGTQAGHHVRRLLEGKAKQTILHLHGVWEPLLAQAAKAARKMGSAYVVTPHGMLDPWSLQQSAAKKKLALTLGRRAMLQQAAFLHLLNDDENELLTPLNLSAPRQVIPNGVFMDEIDPLPPEGQFRGTIAEKCPGLGNHPFVLFLSRVHPKKGLDRLVRAISELEAERHRVHLVIAGPDGGAEADNRQLARSLGMEDHIHWVGPLWGRDRFAAMIDAACFCLPSRQEGFSLAITEAMACGKAVVISKSCHFPQVNDAGAGMVVDLKDENVDDDAEALAQALREVLTQPHKAAAMGREGRRLVEERFTWPVVVRQMIEAYQPFITEEQAAEPATAEKAES